MPKLEITLPDAGQFSHELMDDVVTVGRLADNTIQLEDISVSSHHAQLTQEGSHYRLKDLGSTNGSFVNGEPVTEKLLTHSDVIRFGQIEAVYLSAGAASTVPLPEKELAPVAVATSSARPAGFANASPFKANKKKKDPVAMAIFAFTALAILAFAGAVVGILMLRPPGQ
jgi:pSer/pThr/pTyr-binding forkhead associated (FHA) protein